MEDFKQYLIAKGYSQQTTHGILKDTTKFITWLHSQNLEEQTLNYNDITAYVKYNQQRGIKPITVQHLLINTKHYLNYLVEANEITHNPALALKLRNTKTKTVYNIINYDDLEHIYNSYQTESKKHLIAPPQIHSQLARKRNKVLLSLIIYQGITAEDINNIELQHLELREGKITIPSTRRSNERSLKLESHQIFNLYDYINETRKAILQLTAKQSNKLLLSVGSGSSLQNALQQLLNELKTKHPQVQNLDQLRASVIIHWLKNHNKRKVQYMAGHKYISSTERYEASNIDELKEDVEKYYPINL
jgi:site-specific recombinase XerD